MARFALLVTSDRVYRGEREDEVTPLVQEVLESRGHLLAYRAVVPNDPWVIRRRLVEALTWADVVLVTGGTGPSPRDVSVDVVESLAEKRLPGLGEEHRRRSRERVGFGALVSRTGGYIVGGRLVYVSPGSPDAVRLALEILLEGVEHLVAQARGAPHRPACPHGGGGTH